VVLTKNEKIFLGVSVLAIVVLLVCALAFLSLYRTGAFNNDGGSVVVEKPKVINRVSVFPKTADLVSHRNLTFTAGIGDAVGGVTFSWRIENLDGTFSDYSFDFNDDYAFFVLHSHTEEDFKITVRVVDSRGYVGEGFAVVY
jgi:hypothetical protein